MNANPTTANGKVFPAVWKLVHLNLLISFNGFKHAKLRRKILTVLGVLGLVTVAGLVLFLSVLLLNFLHSPTLKQYAGVDVTPFLQVVPVLIFTGLFVGILFTSFGVLLQSLYLAGDMDFLLSSPVPVRAVFVSKMLQAVLPNFGLTLLFGLPVLYGLGISNHYNLLYYPLVILLMVAIALAAAGVSAMLVMLVVRVLPPRRAAEILGFLGAIIAFTCSQAGNVYNSFGHSTDISGQQVSNLFGLLVRYNTPWLPLNWAGQGLVALGEGHWLIGLLLPIVTLAGCAAIFFFALATAERLYYSGWAGMQVIATRKKQVRTIRPSREAENVTGVARLIPAAVRGIVWKDFLLLRRDLRNLSQLISPLIFGVVYTFMFLRPGSPLTTDLADMPPAFATIMQLVTTYGNIGMSLFVGWMLLSRLAGMAFSSEGKNYWVLKSAPVRARQLLTGKFLVAYLPTLGLGIVFLVGVTILQKASLGGFLYSLLAVVMCLAGMNGILLSFGVAGANFKWEDPRRMSAGGLGCLGQFVTILFLPIAFGLFVGPLLVTAAVHVSQLYGYLIGGVLGCALSATCALLPPWLVQNRVERLAEE